MENAVRILVTGANGFVGGSVIEELEKHEKFEIYALQRAGNEKQFNKKTEKKFYCDIADYETFKQIEQIGKVDIVIHCAGLAHQFGTVREEDFRRVNVRGTENVCKLAVKLGAKKMIHLSSVAVYGDHGQKQVDETFKCRPVGVYAESKFAGETAAQEICKDKNIGLTILRPATIIGENDRGNTARLITTIDNGNFVWIGNGRNFKSLIYKKDVARATLKVVNSSKSNLTEIYNVCGESISMKIVVETIFKSLGKTKARLKIPESFLHSVFGLNKKIFNLNIFSKYEKVVEKWLSDDIFSGEKFNRDFDFYIVTSVAEAIGLQVENYLESKK